jgi:hypothetical protein
VIADNSSVECGLVTSQLTHRITGGATVAQHVMLYKVVMKLVSAPD